MEIYHTKIETVTICKNGSEKFGSKSTCMTSVSMDKKFFEVTMNGKTKVESEQKLINWPSEKGRNSLKEVPMPDQEQKNITRISRD